MLGEYFFLMNTEIQILIADDHPIVRQGLRQAIEIDPGLKVVAEAGDGHAALAQLRALKPEIAIIDIDMPGADGFSVARSIRDERLPIKVIFLTVYREESFFDQAMEVGAKGYVLKDSAIADIVSGIKAVAAGQHFTSPAMTSYLMNRGGRSVYAAPAPGQPQLGLKDLTPTERRVLKLIAEYKTSKDIAEELFISFRTVNTHRANICQKLGIEGSHALMKFALAHQSELL